MNKSKETKAFVVRLPKDIWKFLKRAAIEQERSMTDIISSCVMKYQKRLENKLTDYDISV